MSDGGHADRKRDRQSRGKSKILIGVLSAFIVHCPPTHTQTHKHTHIHAHTRTRAHTQSHALGGHPIGKILALRLGENQQQISEENKYNP